MGVLSKDATKYIITAPDGTKYFVEKNTIPNLQIKNAMGDKSNIIYSDSYAAYSYTQLLANQSYSTGWLPFEGFESVSLVRYSDQLSAVGGDNLELSPDGGITVFPGSAATNTVKHYTANPTLGTAVGTITRRKILLPIATTVSDQSSYSLMPLICGNTEVREQSIILRGTAQQLSINFNGAALPAGAANWYATVCWTEE